jgi:hypothetical protein
VRRSDVVTDRADRAIAAGSWVHEKLLRMPAPRGFDSPNPSRRVFTLQRRSIHAGRRRY